MMEIRDLHLTRGPNYWSNHRHKLVIMVLSLNEMEAYPSNKIDGFANRLKRLLPTLYRHRCSYDEEGGFLRKVEEGTCMGHIIEHIALEIQTLAGMDTGFGRTRGYGEKGVYHVVFNYEIESVGRVAARASVEICQALIDGQEKAEDLEQIVQHLIELRKRDCLGPSTASIIREAETRGIPWIRLNPYSLFQLGHGAKQKRIQATMSSNTNSIAEGLADDKEETKRLLEYSQIPVPKGLIIANEAELQEACEEIGYPLVTKPIDGNHGRGITVAIRHFNEAVKGFRFAQSVSERVIIEQYLSGADYRLLVINNKLVAAAKRTPAHVTGDGQLTIQQLIEQVNSDPKRGLGHEQVLTKIDIDEPTLKLIRKEGYSLATILPKDERLILKDTANLSTGGTSEDVTDRVHPANVAMAERISKLIGLDICGIDISAINVSEPFRETGGAVLEVNAAPGFRMHLSPLKGLPRNVAAPMLDQLFPQGDTGRIPIVAVTGTNGKTTTTRLIAHLVKMKGYQVGYTTSDGIYIRDQLLERGDCSGPGSAEFVLRDPTVDFAVLECARGGILRSGLGFGACDIGVVTNVAADHLGSRGIQTIEQLARVKSVVPENVRHGGYAVLNADDDLVYKMRKNTKGNLALFSMEENNPRIKALQKLKGITAVYEKGYVTLSQGSWKMRILKASEIPLTFEGKARFMIQNTLPAIIVAHLQGISIEKMRVGLQTFLPSGGQTPGRLNHFQFKNFEVLLDFAHNPAGLMALKDLVDQWEASIKLGIITGTGDRRTEDIIEMGRIAASTFDKIIIRKDADLRGRTPEEIANLVKTGILDVEPKMDIQIMETEADAINYALKLAPKEALVVVCTDSIFKSIEQLNQLKNLEYGSQTMLPFNRQTTAK